MKVRAKAFCIWNGSRKRVGDVFEVPDGTKMSGAWELVAGKATVTRVDDRPLIKTKVKTGSESVRQEPTKPAPARDQETDEEPGAPAPRASDQESPI